jgi:neutral ceramidase
VTTLHKLALATLLFAALSCAPVTAPALPPRLALPSTDDYLAGVALADITPPLHLSLFGHGPESRVATGVRLRLRCEVFVLASAGQAVALVPCDLSAPSRLLQRSIAARLAQRGIPIGPEGLFLMARHTHAGPAHYFAARRYSGTLSSIAPGFDPAVVDFLADRIADKISQAFHNLTPACLSWASRDLTGLSFNRSHVPFLANQREPVAPGQRDIQLTAHQAEQPSAGASAQPTGAEAAVDPQLTVLRIARRQELQSCEGAQLRGVLAIYGVHPTAVPNTNELYHGDLFGFAVRTAEGGLAASSQREAFARESAPPEDENNHVIVGLANGVEGDVSPKLSTQSFLTARHIGRQLGEAIARLGRAQLGDTEEQQASASGPTPALDNLHITTSQARGPLQLAARDLHFPGAAVGPNTDQHLCNTAELGIAAGGGAQDGPTRLRTLREANAGYRLERPYGCHGYKLSLRSGSPQRSDFPEIAPIGLVQIAQGLIASAPAELTTIAGQRIRSQILQHLAQPPESIALTGLTNEYLQYITTREEYDFQYYEAASNLYGPHTLSFVANQFGELATLLHNPTDPARIQLTDFTPKPGPTVHRMPPTQVPAPEPMPAPVPPPVGQCIRDAAPGAEIWINALPLSVSADRQHFSVQVLSAEPTGDQLVDDDRGASLEVRELADKWRIRWIPDLAPGTDPRCGKPFKLAVRGVRELTTEPFTLRCDPNPQSDHCEGP